MRHPQLVCWLALVCLAATTACGSSGSQTSRTEDTATRARSASPAADQAIGARPTKTQKPKKKKKRRKVLAGQLVAHPGGGGRGPDCVSDLPELPSEFATSSAVWLSGMNGPKNVPLAFPAALCLHGFSEDQPVTVTLTAGTRSYRTTVVPASGKVSVSRFEPPETLFNGRRLRVFDVGAGLLESNEWGFVPPSPARDAIVTAGAVTLDAEQAGTSASHRQAVTVATPPGQDWIPGQRHQLVIFGFQQDEEVPVGLYRRTSQAQTFTLVREIGAVTMPRSRIAVFTVPGAVTVTGDGYCVSAPLDTVINCPAP
ncbi:hypothetical protein PV396_13175 [Streptomyces sp. ME02-8801-2C]|uniref:hypothetical protein n=1 Tax=Streptomyces sp. ME02-8801-2C TaxID=3028680 RepID=UPI0029AB4957|nr:hypothetical protein [Streptomyces sp. ME02-8801-2C]MDX3452890.1 hypothetical protein [Streptomyces sp. ME02-8801-2C]